jgi:hypothetical protein
MKVERMTENFTGKVALVARRRQWDRCCAFIAAPGHERSVAVGRPPQAFWGVRWFFAEPAGHVSGLRITGMRL